MSANTPTAYASRVKDEASTGLQPVMASPWMTIHEAAAYCKCSAKTLYREVAAGRLTAATIGGRRSLRFRAEYLDAWLEATTTPIEVPGRG